MKYFPIFVFIIIFGNCDSQIFVGYTKNFDIYKPYTSLTQEYMDFNNKIYSNTQTLNLRLNVKQIKKINWDFGIIFKRINHVVDDKVLTYYNKDGFMVEDKLDMVSESNSFGFLNQFDFLIAKKKNFTHKIGFINELFFIENFKSIYINEKGENSIDDLYYLNISPQNSYFGTQFFMSSINLSCHYLFEFHPDENFSLATKISLGTNLYSDWDQFKKYAWLGVGLEMGFGKKKTPKPVEVQ